MPWDVVKSYFGGDETVNFGPRQESGTALYQIDTISTISSSEKSVHNVPQIVTSVLGELAMLMVEQHVSIFTDMEHTSTFGYDSVLDEGEWSPDGDMLVLGSRHGKLYIIDTETMETVFALTILPQAKTGKTFRKIMFTNRNEDQYDLVIVGSSRQLTVLRGINKEVVLSENVKEWAKDKLCTVKTDEIHTEGLHDVVAWRDCLVTMGEGEVILAVWKWEEGQLVLDDEVHSFLSKDAGLLNGKVSSDGNYLFARDSNNILSLWCTRSLVILKQWDDLDVREFQLLETREIQNHSLQGMKLVILKMQDSKHTMLLIQNLPEQDIVYSLQLHASSTLARCSTLQEILYLAECCPDEQNDASTSTVRYRCLTETNPETRLYRILHKNKFEEAIMFAKMYRLEVELVYKVKINFLLDQLSPWNVKKYPEDKVEDMIPQLWDCLDNIKDDLHVADICMRAALPSLADSEKLLLYCKQRLLKFAEKKSTDVVAKEKQQDLLTKMTEILNRLTTFRIIHKEDQYSAEPWDHFLKADLVQEAFVYLKRGQLDIAVTILSRHESELENISRPEMIEDFLSFIPDAVKAIEILGFFQHTVIPFVINKAPEKLVSLTKWLMQRATNMELLEKTEWPLNALQFLRSIYGSLQSATALNLSGDSSFVMDIENKTKVDPEDVLEPMKSLIANLQHLHDLHAKYRCNLSFGQFLQETTESVAFRMLDKVVAIELMQKTLDRQIKPYIKEHGLKEDQIFSKYVKDYLERTGGITSYIGEAPWEAKVIAVIGCISNAQQKCEAILETMKLAPVPWSDQVERLVQSGLQLNHPKVAELKEQYSLVNVRKLMAKYGLKGVPSIELGEQLIFFILNRGEPDCLNDALKVVKAYDFEEDIKVYLFHLRNLIFREKLLECMDLLKSLPREMSLRCSRRTVHYVQVLLNDPTDLNGEESYKIKRLFTEAAIFICRYLIGIVKDHFEQQDLESLLLLLRNLLAFQSEFRKFPTLQQFDDPIYRRETFVTYMEDVLVKRSSSEGQPSYTKMYRLADILQVPHFEIHGELAIKAAVMGDIPAAIKFCRKLLELDPTEEIAKTLYDVSVAFQRRYAEIDDMNQYRELPAIIFELISQALIYCPSHLVSRYLEVSNTAYLTLAISRQCEVGEKTLPIEDWGLFDPDSDPAFDKEWSVDNTFNEDALVMNSSIILPLVCQYAVAHPSLEEDPETTGDVEETDVSPMMVMYKTLVPILQHLEDSSHHQLACQFILNAVSTVTQMIFQKDMGLPFVDEKMAEEVLKEQQGFQQLETLAQPWIKEVAASLLMKIFNSKNVDHKLALTILTGRPQKESLETLMKIIKTAGHNYKKLQAVAVVGMGIGQLLKEPTVIKMCEKLEVNARWGHRFSKLKINFKSAFQGPSSEKIKVLPQIAQCEAVSVDLVTDFCRSFNLDEDEGLLLYLEHVLTASDQTTVSADSEDVGKSAKLSKASAAIRRIKLMDCLLEKLRTIYHKCNSYDYETLKFLLEEIKKISGQSDIDKDLKLLEYLKVYTRKCEPSEYELKYKPDVQKDELHILMTLPPESRTRLPFHALVDGDAWKIITQELSKDTIHAWLPIAKLLKLNANQTLIMTITNMVKHYVGMAGKSEQGSSSGGKDKSQWNWDSKDANVQLLQDIQELLMKVSSCEMALACAQWVVKEMPLGAEKVLGLCGCLKLAELWFMSLAENSPEKEKANAAYMKFVAAHQRLATEQVLFGHKMVEPELMKLSGNAEKLIIKLYEHPDILQTENDKSIPDIHTIAEKIASINKIDIQQIRMSLMEKWLPSASSKQADGESTMTFNFEHLKFGDDTVMEASEGDHDNLTRVMYLLQRGSQEANIVFLFNFAFKQNASETDSLTTLCKVRAIRCLLKMKDEKMIRELCDKSFADLRKLLKIMNYLVGLEKLHILHSAQTFEVANKEGLIKGIWRNHSHQKTAALLVASLCLEYQVHDKQIWSSVLQQLLKFGLYQDLELVLLKLNFVPKMWLVPSFPKVWQTVLMNPLTKVVAPLSPDQIDVVVQSLVLIQRCPIPRDIDLAGLSKQFQRLEMPACALFCLELMSSDTEQKEDILSTHKTAVLENLQLLMQHGSVGFAMKMVEEAVYRYLLEKEDFGAITTSQFLTKFTKYAIQKKNIDSYLKFTIVNKRVKDAEKLLSLYCSYNPDILHKMKNYMDEDEEEEFASLQGYLRMRELHDVIQML